MNPLIALLLTPALGSPVPCDSAKAGAPCAATTVCVVDRGEPCGWSSLLWCREGVWVAEKEQNLCEPPAPAPK